MHVRRHGGHPRRCLALQETAAIETACGVCRTGLRTRVVGRTRCNNYSSRSHVIFVLHVPLSAFLRFDAGQWKRRQRQVEQQSLQGEERLGKTRPELNFPDRTLGVRAFHEFPQLAFEVDAC